MPATPLHCSIAYLIKRWKWQLSLPALLVSTMVPDLEIPFTYLITRGLQHRLVLHGMLGAATMGTFLSVLLTVFLYPSLVSLFFGLDKEKVERKCWFSWNLVALCFVGNLSHVFVDSLHHEFNPILYPFVKKSFGALVLMGDWVFATIIVTSVLVLLLFFFVYQFTKGTEDFWMRMLVG